VGRDTAALNRNEITRKVEESKMIRSIRGVKYWVDYKGEELMLAFTGPERMRVFRGRENVSREFRQTAAWGELMKLADTAAKRCTMNVSR
jgi:hypothetical protein